MIIDIFRKRIKTINDKYRKIYKELENKQLQLKQLELLQVTLEIEIFELNQALDNIELEVINDLTEFRKED